jgi:hypothetical protein
MTMLLLGADQVDLYPPGDLDGHGWQEETPTRRIWTGTGNLQLLTGQSDPRASDGGGRGPHDPARIETGNLFLPLGADPADGMTAVIRGQAYAVSEVRVIADPVLGPGAGIACHAMTVTVRRGG